MLSFERLNKIMTYNKETGILKWAIHRSPKVRAGDIAGSEKNGYLSVMVDGKHYYAHRLAWLFIYREWPKGLLDHKNGNRSDNRICNLREATHSQNNQNKMAMRNNKSGVKGAWKREGKWRSAIKVDGKIIPLGWFSSAHGANAAYEVAAKRYFGDFGKS